MGRLSIAAQAVFETTTPDLGGRHRIAWLYAALVLLGIFLLDVILPIEIHISVLYLFPILLVTWNVGKRSGITMAILSACATTLADRITGVHYAHLWIPIAETTLRTLLFVVFSLIMAELRRALSAEKELARIDALTGVANRRSFIEHVTQEILRAHRYKRPYTVAYVDIDGFKEVNDQLGHGAGDALLRLVATTLYTHVRRTDAVARLGGDEFAISLAETDADAARATMEIFRDRLHDAIGIEKYPVTFSIGVVTFVKAVRSAEDVIHRADTLMYTVKKSGKNKIAHEVVGA